MATRSLSLPGRPSRLSHVERKGSISLRRRKQVHWSNELEEVIYFPPDCSTLSTDGLFDRRVKLMRSKSLKTLYKSKRLPLKATQSLARGINDANSSLIRTGVNIITQQLDRFKSRSENLEIFDQESNSRWKELLRHYQKRMRDLLEEQEEEWVWCVNRRTRGPTGWAALNDFWRKTGANTVTFTLQLLSPLKAWVDSFIEEENTRKNCKETLGGKRIK